MTVDGRYPPDTDVAEMIEAILLEAAKKLAGAKAKRRAWERRSRQRGRRLRQLAVALEMSSGGQIDILQRLINLSKGEHHGL